MDQKRQKRCGMPFWNLFKAIEIMEIQILQSILGQLSPSVITPQRWSFISSALQDNQLLQFLFADAEQDMSETHQKSVEIRNKLLRRVPDLLNAKQEAATRFCGLALLREICLVATYELTLANYESWFAVLLGIISPKVRNASAAPKFASFALAFL